ncbi:MAG TPA: NADH-quinone oxidoreductase subunit J [Trueperaceae bacterium]|nr:NADH-quinone oxidoreductase subunit J [Trueperaceae bacterium]
MVGFIILAVILVAGGVGVVLLRQPVHAALSLVATLLALAVTYVTLQAHFLAAIQVIVYAGAILVLFLFVIMLLNVGGETAKDRLAWLKPAAWVAGGITAAAVVAVAVLSRTPLPEAAVVNAALGGGNADKIGELLFSDYLLAFQLVGVLLMTGVVAAVSLVQRAAPETRPQRGPAARGAPHEPFLGVRHPEEHAGDVAHGSH